MIQSFRCAETRTVYEGGRSKVFGNALDDLRVPPGNRLESLSGDRAGQHSIRVNDQYRICFRWTPQGPANVETVDYHS